MAIELVGYKSVLANSLYTKEAGDTFEVMLFRRYRYPSEEQVARFVVANAQRLLKNRNVKNEEEFSIVSAVLGKMPEEIVRQIAERDSDAIDSIKTYAPTIYSTTPSPTLRCLSVKLGLIDASLLSRKPDTKNPLQWYEEEISASHEASGHKLGWKWQLELMLKNYYLQERDLIDLLIAEGVHKCKRYTIEGLINAKEFLELLDILYNNFNKVENVKQLVNTSRSKLESQALEALERIQQDYETVVEEQSDKEDKIRRAIQNRFGDYPEESEKERGWLFGEN